MIGRFRRVTKRQQRELDPLVKVAGVPTRRDAEACLEALEAKAIEAEIREDGPAQGRGAFELWARASQEPQARLVMGLSGRSVIRLERHRGEGEGKG